MRREPQNLPPLATQPITADVLREKYLKDGETSVDELFRRVARAVARAEEPALRAGWEQRFFDNLQAGAIGAGRIMSAAGTQLAATLINCFVQPVGDCIQGRDDEGFPGIYEALREAAETMRRGGGVGYDFSRVRPRGAKVKATASIASGPCSYIDVFDASCATVESAGARRGAQMGVLRIDHPDVLEFITAKRKPGRWNNFNVSVAVSEEFMHALQAGSEWALVHRAEPGDALRAQGAHRRADGMWVYRTLPARELWDTVMTSAYDFAEPGILFMDTINRDNNLRAIEKITAVNPCVTADTWVMTAGGPAQVHELVDRPFSAVVDGKAYPAGGFFKTGAKPVLRLRTRQGHELRLTADHRVRRVRCKTRHLVEVEWAPAGELREGDEVILHDHRTMRGWPGTGTEQEGYLIGLLIGDGHLMEDKAVLAIWAPELKLVGDRRSVVITSGAAGVIEAAEAAAGALKHRSDFRGFGRPIAGGRGEMRLSSAPLRDLANRLGLRPGNKTVTPQLEKQSSDFARGMLRGLFDADGSVQGSQQKGVSVRLTQTDAGLLKAVQRILLRMGIASSIYLRKPAGLKLLPDGRGSLKEYAIKDLHELIISGDNLQLYSEYIGFCDDVKRQKLYDLLGAYKRRLNGEQFTATIQSVTDDGVEDVFDTTVEQVHAFDANGLYVHNCGEQSLPSYGCCNLGPVILTRFVRHPFGAGGLPAFDFDAFRDAVAVQVRFLDNVLDVTHWPLPQQRDEAMAKRRIGVGFTGLGDALVMLGLRYDAQDGRDMAARISRCMRDAAYAASVELAKEKGAFPAFDAAAYLEHGTFASRLDADVQQAIRTHGIRNSHLLSIAPTGTVSLAFADNASNGIEPAFSWTYRRRKREADGTTAEYEVEDHAWRLYRATGGDAAQLPPSFVSAMQMPASAHLAMMQAVQPFIDAAISKTVNVAEDYPYEEFKDLYLDAWRAGLKGLATYRPNKILGAVLETAKQEQPVAATPDPMRAVIERRPQGTLPAAVEKIEYWTQQGRQSLYLVVSFLPLPDGRERAIEFFMPIGQSHESQQWITSSMRLLSLSARGGFLERALADMRKVAWDRGPVRLGTHVRPDGTSVPLWHDSEVAAIAYAIQNIIARRQGAPAATLATPEPAAATATSTGAMAGSKCPECGAPAVIKKDGCEFCTQCGHVGACG